MKTKKMSTDKQLKSYREAMRYIDKATKILAEKGNAEDGLYQDIKQVRSACGTAYSGLLVATEGFLEMKGKPVAKKKRRRQSVEEYRENLALVDRHASDNFKAAHNVLLLDGYYDGMNGVGVLKSGINAAMEILNRIAPRNH